MRETTAYRTDSWIDPRIEIRPSPTHGRGMFATAPIRSGEVVNVWGGTLLLTERDIRGWKAIEWRDRGYSWATIGEGLYLAGRGDDPADCINHSCDPNVWMRDEVTLVARRDIAAGKELTIDYALFEEDEGWTAPWSCRCGSEYCRGGHSGRAWRRRDLQERYGDHFSPFINERIRATRLLGWVERELAPASCTSAQFICEDKDAMMKLELTVVLSCADTVCQVKTLGAQTPLRACRSAAMIEHDIAVRPGQLVAVEERTAMHRIVYRWPDIVIDAAPDGGYALTRDGQALDPDRLRRDAFPEIEAMYALMEEAQAISPKQVVQKGYDRIAERYVEWVRDRSAVRTRYTGLLLDGLPPGAEVLDLSCGAGGPTTLALAGRFSLTGVDLSPRSVALARKKVPGATFLAADMAEVDFPPGSFDGVAAFYSLIHVPREFKGALLARIASWLRPGGLFVATMGTHSAAVDYDDDFLGVPMYWSTFDSETNRRLVEQAELEIVSARQETEKEDGQPVTFLWVVARKPDTQEAS